MGVDKVPGKMRHYFSSFIHTNGNQQRHLACSVFPPKNLIIYPIFCRLEAHYLFDQNILHWVIFRVIYMMTSSVETMISIYFHRFPAAFDLYFIELAGASIWFSSVYVPAAVLT